ncbi:MAG: pilus assembly protein [Caloramator sp.]|nr:pilus assembly protein [Caloramator sp.]
MKKKGQSLVEFAIILPVLVFIFFGIIEFGLIMNSYIVIQSASREGARVGIVGGTDGDILNFVYSAASNLDRNRITVNINPNEGARKSGDTLTVEVRYDYNILMPIIRNILGGNIRLRAKTSMRVE